MCRPRETMEAFFREFDSQFQEAGGLNFNATELLVRSQVDLPIPVLVNSEVEVQFSTANGDILFSMHFAPSSGDGFLEVFEATRVPSDVSPYRTSFRATEDGTLLLLWDNSFSWFTLKYLSYHIEILAPSLQEKEDARCVKARSLLWKTVGDIQVAESHLAESKSRMQTLKSDILLLEQRANAMRVELRDRKKALDMAYNEADEMAARIDSSQDKTPGLCIRCLNKALLITVFGYLDQATTITVCKYWRLICLAGASSITPPRRLTPDDNAIESLQRGSGRA